jgi:hypothetical protein
MSIVIAFGRRLSQQLRSCGLIEAEIASPAWPYRASAAATVVEANDHCPISLKVRIE